MILLYTPQITSRLSYIARFLFETILGVRVTITTNRDEFDKSSLPRINYSHEESDCITIFPHPLLAEDDINFFTPQVSLYNNIPILFPGNNQPDIPFDPFAAAFFMVSRYEEYRPQHYDQHQRVMASESVAFQNNFLEIPVVDHWAMFLKQLIEEYYPKFVFPERKYTYIPTIDVDIAYAYRYRSFLRTSGAVAKAIIKRNKNDLKLRWDTLIQGDADPFDTYDLFSEWHKQYGLNPVYFFLVGQYGPYDKNISPFHPSIRKLIHEIGNNNNVGLHPSYGSNANIKILNNELKILESILGRKVTASRQHFLKLNLPETYQRLIDCGITEDYTMGYADAPGFRAGTCTPFPFYDLRTETETTLMVYPFQVMDGTLNHYKKFSVLEALETMSLLINEVKKVNGTFISLWHNESLGEMREWEGWRVVYQQLLSLAT
ncbi:MAG: polysaccharide deacetylase family protein [Bacteroidota bacterium]|nr:polysaccharide deacetylase family protein [Bacteroidota bacterium]